MLKILVSTPSLLSSKKSLPVHPARYIQCGKGSTCWWSIVRFFAEIKSLSRYTLEILSASWRVGTGKRYNSHVERFVKFCCERYTEKGLEFLTEYFKTRLGYSSVNSARSALSNIIKLVCNIPFGKSPLVCRLLKRVFKIRPALPRYVTN